MGLFLLRGSGALFPERAREHLEALSGGACGLDGGPAPELIRVALSGGSGPGAERLARLAGGGDDVVIVAAEAGFTANDGSILAAQGGAMVIPPGAAGAGASLNPSTATLVVYDTSGAAGALRLDRALRQLAGEEVGGEAPVLAGEGGSRAGGERDRLGVARPDLGASDAVLGPASGAMNGPASGPMSGCAVCDLAGADLAGELAALRSLRDGRLRRSEVGFDFFDRLYADCDRFSPRVCDLAAADRDVRRFLETCAVRPLVGALQLFRAHLVERVDSSELARRFERRARSCPELSRLGADALEALRAALERPGGGAAARLLPGVPAGLDQVGALLERRALGSPTVKWAVADVLAVFLRALEARADRLGEPGLRLAAAIDAWSAELPITAVWPSLTRQEMQGELAFLRRTLLRSPSAERRFLRRLVQAFPRDLRVRAAVVAAALAKEAR